MDIRLVDHVDEILPFALMKSEKVRRKENRGFGRGTGPNERKRFFRTDVQVDAERACFFLDNNAVRFKNSMK